MTEETKEPLEKAAKHASKAAHLADKASEEAQAAADQVRNAAQTNADATPRDEPEEIIVSADVPVSTRDYLNAEQGSGSTLPGDDPITRPDY